MPRIKLLLTTWSLFQLPFPESSIARSIAIFSIVSIDLMGYLRTISATDLSLELSQKISRNYLVPKFENQNSLLPQIVYRNFYPINLLFERFHQKTVVFVLVEVSLWGNLKIRPNVFADFFHHFLSFLAKYFVFWQKYFPEIIFGGSHWPLKNSSGL